MKSWPATRTWPEVARSRPAITISSEVLPEPLGPTTATDFAGRDFDIDPPAESPRGRRGW